MAIPRGASRYIVSVSCLACASAAVAGTFLPWIVLYGNGPGVPPIIHDINLWNVDAYGSSFWHQESALLVCAGALLLLAAGAISAIPPGRSWWSATSVVLVAVGTGAIAFGVLRTNVHVGPFLEFLQWRGDGYWVCLASAVLGLFALVMAVLAVGGLRTLKRRTGGDAERSRALGSLEHLGAH